MKNGLSIRNRLSGLPLRLGGTFLVLFLLSVSAPAQPRDRPLPLPHPFNFYTYYAPGVQFADSGDTVYHRVGGGGESRLTPNFGLAFDLGYATRLDAGFQRGVGIFSPGVYYRLGGPARTRFFLTGGYSIAFRSGSASGGHFGVGVHHWAGRRTGLRLEVRHHVFDIPSANHHLEGRIGLVIR